MVLNIVLAPEMRYARRIVERLFAVAVNRGVYKVLNTIFERLINQTFTLVYFDFGVLSTTGRILMVSVLVTTPCRFLGEGGDRHTWTLKTPQIGWEVMFLVDLKMALQSFRSPLTILTLGDFCSNFWAEAESGDRVTATIVKFSARDEASRALMVAPPCLPVAPVMRRTLDMTMRLSYQE